MALPVNKNGFYIFAAALAVAVLCVVVSFMFSNILKQIFIFSGAVMLLAAAAAYFFNREIKESGKK